MQRCFLSPWQPSCARIPDMFDVEVALAALSLSDRCRLLGGATNWRTHAVAHAGVPAIKMSDGPNGVRGEGSGPDGTPGVVVPAGITLGATWDVDLVGRIGDVLGREAVRRSAHVLLAPTVNLHRTPVGGRTFECFSEDPELTGRLAVAYVRGVQSHDVAVTVKHFAGNDTEIDRMTVDVRADERTLREVYLPTLRAGGPRRRGVGRDERLQPPPRRLLREQPLAAHEGAPRGLGLRRRGGLRLVRSARDRELCARRAQRRDARSRHGVRRGARGGGRARRRQCEHGRRARPGAARARRPDTCRRAASRRTGDLTRRPCGASTHPTGGDRRHGAAAQLAAGRNLGRHPPGAAPRPRRCAADRCHRPERRRRPLDRRRIGQPATVPQPDVPRRPRRTRRQRYHRRRVRGGRPHRTADTAVRPHRRLDTDRRSRASPSSTSTGTTSPLPRREQRCTTAA